jgi:hypothetical protein
VGKSTLAEALVEEWDNSAMLDGDHLIALNPLPPNELEYLHVTICLLVEHHRKCGYLNFVINHLWRTEAELRDLVDRLEVTVPDQEIRCFLLTLPEDENLKRVRLRQESRAIDELEYELEALTHERALLYATASLGPGEPFSVSALPDDLVEELKVLLGIE